MSDTYEEYRKRWGGGFLARPVGQAWQGAHGRHADALVARLKAAVKASFPGEAPSDALPYLASELQIPRSPADTDSTYSEKLRRAWDVWPFAGTPLGLLLALEAAGYPAGMVTLVQQEQHGFQLNADTTLPSEQRLTTLALSGGRWTFTADRTLWNRFGVLFGDSSNLPSGWGSASSPPSAVTTPTADTVNGLIRLVNKWRRSAAIFQWIKVSTSGRYWGKIGQAWGTGNWGSSTVVTFGPGEY